jgi:outer membrane protein assembly factor BamB
MNPVRVRNWKLETRNWVPLSPVSNFQFPVLFSRLAPACAAALLSMAHALCASDTATVTRTSAPCVTPTLQPFPAGWDSNSPTFRGPSGSGRFPAQPAPVEWDENSGSNIAWKSRVPLPGLSSPAVWDDRVFVTGATRERRELYCFGASDGALRWTGTYASDPKTPADYQVYEPLADRMHAVPTPATDGHRVYAMYGNGELACFDAATGKALWSRLLGSLEGNSYGLAASPVVWAGSVIVEFDGAKPLLCRLDGATGRELWKSERSDFTWASPVLARANGGWQVVVAGSPDVSGWDPETGRRLWSLSLLFGDVAPSPVAEDGAVYVSFQNAGIFGIALAQPGQPRWTLDKLKTGTVTDGPSMVADGALLFHFYGNMLACLDAKTGRVLSEKTLPGTASYASPMIVGRNLYLFCGTQTFVGEATADFTVARTCELAEKADASPAVARGRIYLRGEDSLYCLGHSTLDSAGASPDTAPSLTSKRL